MAEVILHHYDGSPFGQMIRLCLAHKGLAWKSVDQPMVVPKPDLSALTGGYERIPVLQFGSDIYCDTALITQFLDAHTPDPTLYPGDLGKAGRMIASWSGNLWFMPAVAVALGTNPDVVSKEFWEDRAKRFGMTQDGFMPMVPHLAGQFDAGMELLRDALGDGRDYVAGEAAGHADFALFVNVRFVGFGGRKPADFGPEVAAWFDRLQAIGDGNRENWTGEQAIEHARGTSPVGEHQVAEGSGFSRGDRVSVTTESPDPAAVTGELLGLTNAHIVLAREDDRAGLVHVHFPRIGQIVRRA